jgi:hypothetical protein
LDEGNSQEDRNGDDRRVIVDTVYGGLDLVWLVSVVGQMDVRRGDEPREQGIGNRQDGSASIDTVQGGLDFGCVVCTPSQRRGRIC